MSELWVEKAIEIVKECKFQEYDFQVITSPTTKAVYLQATYQEKDTVTGLDAVQYTRRWFLSPEMSRSEIVQTAFKCVLTSMEHRVREWFLYSGRAIFQPHYDVDSLWEICEEREVRPGMAMQP